MAKVETQDELVALIKAYEAESDPQFDSTLSDERQKAMEYYLGEPNGREREGYSQVVTREVLETVEAIVPYLMKLHFSGDEVVRFSPVSDNDIEQAKQETDYVHWVFTRKNPGFRIMETVIRDALIQKNGVCKRYWEEKEVKQREVYEGKTMEEVSLLLSDPNVEAVEANGTPDGLVDIVVLRNMMQGQVVVEPIPPEEFRINSSAKSIKDARFVAHVTRMTRSEIEDFGFELDETKAGDSNTDLRTRPERIVRHKNISTLSERDLGEAHDDSLKEYQVTEAYLRVDWDQDGHAELRRVILVGSQILLNEETDDIPFVGWTPIMMAHRFEGLSMADLVMPLQLIKTTLTRNMLDNQYLNINGRYQVVEGQVNLDDLLNSKPGGFIRTKAQGALTPLQAPNLGPDAFNMLGLMDQALERRTGVSDRIRGFDPNALNSNQAASAISQVISQAEQRIELIARRFGEEFLVPLFQGIHKLSIKHSTAAQKFRLRDKFVTVNPSTWADRADLEVMVGLGNGNKTERLFHLQQLAATQQTIIAGGGLGILVLPKQVYNLAEDTARLIDPTARNRYFSDPGDITGTENADQPSLEEILLTREQERREFETQEQVRQKDEELLLKQEELQFQREKEEAEVLLKNKELEMEFQLEKEQKRGVSLDA